MRRSCIQFIILLFVLCLPVQAHRPIFGEKAATDPNTAVLITQPAISQVIYRKVTKESKQVWLAFDVKEGFELFMQIGVPVLDHLKGFRPAMLVAGPGLPKGDFQVELPNEIGAKDFPTDSIKEPRFFHEHFTGTDSWILRSQTVVLPKSGRYYVVAYVPSGQNGKLWLSVGRKEAFGVAEWAKFGEWKKRIRKFHEASEDTGGLRIPILSDVVDLFRSVGSRGSTPESRTSSKSSKIERIWLTYRNNTPRSIVVNWETKTPQNSTVRYHVGNDSEQTLSVEKKTTLHHVEIPIEKKNVVYHYSVHSGSMSSLVHTFKGIPTSQFRVAVVANWQRRPAINAILEDDPHLLLTAGDNINNTWQKGGVGNKECTTPYSDLIDAYPTLFRTVPFMPVLGNHDKEFRPRTNKPPDTPVYDIEATAFRKFFELPDEEWKWHFDVPEFDIRFIALDLNHISDMGTTLQACHPFHRDSSQYEWYKSLMDSSRQRFIITLYNEKNSSVRRQENFSWQKMLENGTICISGFGYFAEKAIRAGFVYYNTSLSGTGDKYPDPNSVLLLSKHNYILMTLETKPSRMVVEIKNLEGKTLDKMTLN